MPKYKSLIALKHTCFNYTTKTLTTICLLTLAGIQPSYAQQASDIYIGKLSLTEAATITDIQRITQTEQYTNQPYFFDEATLYFTQALAYSDTMQSQNVDDNIQTQTDVFMCSLAGENLQNAEQSIINVSQSAHSEYSPTPLPNKKGLSVIRVNDEGKQELWKLDTGGKALEHLAPSVEPVGYQVWLNDEELLLFVLGEPHTLQRVHANGKAEAEVIDDNIGASLFRYKTSDWFLYTQSEDTSQGEATHMLKAYNAVTSITQDIVAMPDNTQYFSVTPQGEVVTSNGESLSYINIIEANMLDKGATANSLKVSGNWQSISIERGKCSSGISRTAISPTGTKIAMVCPH